MIQTQTKEQLYVSSHLGRMGISPRVYNDEAAVVRFVAAVIRALFFFFFNDTATTEIYTLSLHDALPILSPRARSKASAMGGWAHPAVPSRSEEHTSELQSQSNLVCRLLLEKKKKISTLQLIVKHKQK